MRHLKNLGIIFGIYCPILKILEFSTGKCEIIIHTVYMFKLIIGNWIYFTDSQFSRRCFLN